MKKIFYIFPILILFLALISITSFTFAATLDNVKVETSKTTIRPGEEVSVNVSFGTNLGAYTANVLYDANIFEYVRSEGGTANDEGDIIILTYYDTTGGSNPRTNATVTFKAKANLTSTNPTDFGVTLTGLSNPDASATYDNILTPIKKNVTVEPNYVDYKLTLNYTGAIKKDEPKEITLTTASTLGRNYDHVKLIAQVTSKPKDTATAKILATKDGTEIDLIQVGYGDTTGYAIGGANVKQELALRGVFDTDGKYTINIRLVDLDDSNKVIAQNNFDITVGEQTTTKTEQPAKTENKANTEKLPTSYPKTGIAKFSIISAVLVVLGSIYFVVLRRKDIRH